MAATNLKPKQLVGQKAPEISLPNHDGTTYTFTPGASGCPTAIFFYPESGTSGCTAEACTFRDALSEEAFKSTQVEIIGISPDGVEKQAKFVKDNKLNFPVLSDEKGDVRKAYGVGKGLFGLTRAGRITYVIDADGTIKDFFESTIKFKAHHKFVQDWLKSYTAPASVTTTEPATTTTTAEPAAPASDPVPEPAPAAPAEPAKEEVAEPKAADAPTQDKPAEDVAAPTEPPATTTENEPSSKETADAVPVEVAEPAAAVAPVPTAAPATTTGVIA